MACLRGIVSRAYFLSSTSPSLPRHCHRASEKMGLSKIWSTYSVPRLQIYAPKFKLMFSTQRTVLQNLNQSGRKLLAGGFLGLSAVAGVMCNQPVVAYAMDDHHAEGGGPSGFLKDDLNNFWTLARKFELPILLLAMVFLGWRRPITLAINVVIFLICTRPNPLSIYMFIEQLRQREMHQNPSPFKTKLLYVKNVEVKDYKLVCLGKVELRDAELDVIGILGGWWVFQTSRI